VTHRATRIKTTPSGGTITELTNARDSNGILVELSSHDVEALGRQGVEDYQQRRNAEIQAAKVKQAEAQAFETLPRPSRSMAGSGARPRLLGVRTRRRRPPRQPFTRTSLPAPSKPPRLGRGSDGRHQDVRQCRRGRLLPEPTMLRALTDQTIEATQPFAAQHDSSSVPSSISNLLEAATHDHQVRAIYGAVIALSSLVRVCDYQQRRIRELSDRIDALTKESRASGSTHKRRLEAEEEERGVGLNRDIAGQ
jgi:hypothetical protein